MLTRYTRLVVTYVITPIARRLVRLGVKPDAVTILGTLGVCIGALVFYPLGQLFWGTVFITAFVFSDTLDGTMARMAGRSSKWGAFLDSSLDRIGDAAVFGGLTLYFAGRGETLMTAMAAYCLAVGGLVPYVKARAESLGFDADVGIAERTDRLVIALVATGLTGLSIPYLLPAALWFVAGASSITVVQRMAAVRRQATGPGRDPGEGLPPRPEPRVGA